MVGRQTPFLALMVPLILIGMVDGRRGIRQAWPVAVVGGISFALAQFACSNYISVELTDIVASLARDGLHRRLPSHLDARRAARSRRTDGRFPRPAAAGGSVHDSAMEQEIVRRDDTRKDPPLDVLRAYAPYLIIIAVLLDRADRGDQGLAGGVAVDDHLRVARARRASPDGEPLTQPDVQLQLAARSRHADADLGRHHDVRARALPGARRCAWPGGRSTSSSGRS